MSKVEQGFEIWWEREGSELFGGEGFKDAAHVAWDNGAFCVEEVEREPAGFLARKYDAAGDVMNQTFVWNTEIDLAEHAYLRDRGYVFEPLFGLRKNIWGGA